LRSNKSFREADVLGNVRQPEAQSLLGLISVDILQFDELGTF